MQLRRMLIFSMPGQVFVSAEAKSVALILGSCVGVCIWDPVNAIGGATHYMLPSWIERELRRPVRQCGYFHIGAEAPGSRAQIADSFAPKFSAEAAC